MDSRIGLQLGNYQLVRLLGRGGFAEVYLAEHLTLETLAAIKLLYGRLGPQDFQNFLQEAKTLAALRHPHILRVLDFGQVEELPYLVMDYAPGGSLRQHHPSGSVLPLSTIVSYVQQVAAALQHTHEAKRIHRDIKPENMLLDERGEVVLSDFGIVAISHSTSSMKTQESIGTVHYMAPEQIQGKPRPASDQYALGVVVYEWLSGARPFTGDSYIHIAMQHISTEPTPLREKVPTIPVQVEQAVTRALRKDPEKRFPSIQEFAIALTQVAQGGIVPTPPVQYSGMTFSPTARAQVGIAPPEAQGYLHAPQTPHPTLRTEAPVISPPPLTTPPSSQRDLPVLTYSGHAEGGLALAWSPDGRLIATGGRDGSVLLWNAENSRAAQTFPSHTKAIHALGWSPNGQFIASGSLDTTVNVWEVASGKRLSTYTGHAEQVTALAWSPDGEKIASGSYDGTMQVWRAETGQFLFTHRAQTAKHIQAVAWSPDGRLIAFGERNGETVQVWHVITGEQVGNYKRFNASDMVGITALSWSPDSRIVAIGYAFREVDLWEVASGRRLSRYKKHSGAITALKWSPGGELVVSGSADGTVQIWEAGTGRQRHTYATNHEPVMALDWSPDERRIAFGSCYQPVQVWDHLANTLLFTLAGHASSIFTLAWSPDGRQIASGGLDKTVQVWEATTGKCLRVYTGHLHRVSVVRWSPDGQMIASADSRGVTHAWRPTTGELLHACVKAEHAVSRNMTAIGLHWFSNGRVLVSLPSMGISIDRDVIQVWEVMSDRRLAKYTKHRGYVDALAGSPDSRLIASGSTNKTVQIWETSTGKHIATNTGYFGVCPQLEQKVGIGI